MKNIVNASNDQATKNGFFMFIDVYKDIILVNDELVKNVAANLLTRDIRETSHRVFDETYFILKYIFIN